MPKESRKSTSRKNIRQCFEVDDESSASDGRTPSRSSSVTGTKRYSPFQRLVPRRESRSDKEMLALREASLSNSKNRGILESGLKYIMVLSLHFLQLCTQFGMGSRMINTDEKICTAKQEDKAVKTDTASMDNAKQSEVTVFCHNCQKHLPSNTSTLKKSLDSTADSGRKSKDEESRVSTRTVTSKAGEDCSSRRDSNGTRSSSDKFCGSLAEDNTVNSKGEKRSSKINDSHVPKEEHNCTPKSNENSRTRHQQDRSPSKEDPSCKRNKIYPSKSDEHDELSSKKDNSVSNDKHCDSNSDSYQTSSSSKHRTPSSDKCRSSQTREERSNRSENNREEHSSKVDSDKYLTSSSSRYYTPSADKCRSSQTKEERSNRSESNREEHSSKMEKKDSPEMKNDKLTDTKEKYNMASRRSPRRSLHYDSDESSDEMVTAAEDSDSSNDRWESPNSTILMTTYIDPGNLINEISMLEQSGVEEPMDISMEEPMFSRSYAILRSPRDLHMQQYSKLSDVNIFSETPISQASSTSSMDEEIAKIFQRQCTSSDDENSSSPSQCTNGRLNNPHCRQREERKMLTPDVSKQISSGKESTPRRRSSSRGRDETKKIVEEDRAKEKKDDDRKETKQREKCESSQSTPSKHKSRSSRTPVKSKDTKRREVKYRERGTQTDSAFSDEDVEMIPIDPRSPDKRTCCRSSGRKSRSFLYQPEEMDQDLEYVADNEDSNDGSVKFGRCRISSESASSSSTSDLGFEERVRITPDLGQGVACWQQVRQPEVRPLHGVQMARAPPGFPEVPQNTPVKFCNCGRPNCFILAAAIANDVKYRSSLVQFPQNYAPAPTPMRHLYHEYPEFMISRDDINASKIFRNIFENNRLY